MSKLMNGSSNARSPNIPIRRSSAKEEDDSNLCHDEVVADFRDFLFYSRIVRGMRRNQDNTKHHDLRYQNEALIDHIVYTRHNYYAAQSPPSSIVAEEEEGQGGMYYFNTAVVPSSPGSTSRAASNFPSATTMIPSSITIHDGLSSTDVHYTSYTNEWIVGGTKDDDRDMIFEMDL